MCYSDHLSNIGVVAAAVNFGTLTYYGMINDWSVIIWYYTMEVEKTEYTYRIFTIIIDKAHDGT